MSAVSASCYLPALSGPTATTKLHWKPEAGAVYDGGFSHRLPCPPGGCRVWLQGVGVGVVAGCGCGCREWVWVPDLKLKSTPTTTSLGQGYLPERSVRSQTRLTGHSNSTRTGPGSCGQACAMWHMLLLCGCWRLGRSH